MLKNLKEKRGSVTSDLPTVLHLVKFKYIESLDRYDEAGKCQDSGWRMPRRYLWKCNIPSVLNALSCDLRRRRKQVTLFFFVFFWPVWAHINLKTLGTRYIESMCQNIFSVDDLFEVLSNPHIHTDFKRPYLRFLLWAYLNTTQVLPNHSFSLNSNINFGLTFSQL